MSEVLGTIKILDDRIITKKDGLVETWSRWSGDENSFIVYDGVCGVINEQPNAQA